MLKLLTMLVTFLLVALTMVALRQHRLELTSQSAQIYDQIRDRHHTLLDQRVQIARQTNPWTLAAALKDSGVNTGGALQPRDTQAGRTGGMATPPPVETDLVAPLLNNAQPLTNDGSGHLNPARPHH